MTDQTTPGNTLPNPWPRILRDITDLALLGLCVATVMAWLGRFWWVADLFSHFVLYYATASVLLFVLALLLRRRRTALVALVILCIHTWTLLPTFLPGRQPPSPIAPRFSLTHVNILCKNRDRDRAVAFFKRCDSDLLVVQEMDSWWERVLSESDIPYRFVVSRRRQDSFGIGLLAHESLNDDARLVIENTRVTDIGKGIDAREWPAIEATLLLSGQRITLLSIHPPPPMSAELAAVRDTILRRAKRWADAQTDPHVIIGDLNTTPWSHAFSILNADGQLISTLDGRGNQGTWPTHLPVPWLLPIDHCLVSREWVCLDRRTGSRTGSDHLPLLVWLALEGQ